jgi:hypothetical protein
VGIENVASEGRPPSRTFVLLESSKDIRVGKAQGGQRHVHPMAAAFCAISVAKESEAECVVEYDVA